MSETGEAPTAPQNLNESNQAPPQEPAAPSAETTASASNQSAAETDAPLSSVSQEKPADPPQQENDGADAPPQTNPDVPSDSAQEAANKPSSATSDANADSMLAHTPATKPYYEDRGDDRKQVGGDDRSGSTEHAYDNNNNGGSTNNNNNGGNSASVASAFRNSEERNACRLFIGNLNTDMVSRDEIANIFNKYGRILEISFHRKYGFVQFDKPEAVQASMVEKGVMIGGKPIDPQPVASGPHDSMDRSRRDGNRDQRDRDHDRDRRSRDRDIRGPRGRERERSPGRSRDREFYGGRGSSPPGTGNNGAGAAAQRAGGVPTPGDGDVVKLLLLGRGQREFAEETARVLERTGVPYKLEMPDGRNLGTAIRDWENNKSRYGVIVGNTSVRTQRVTMKFLREHDRSGKCYTVDAPLSEMVDRILRAEEKLGFTYTPRGGAPPRDMGHQHGGYGGGAPHSYGQSSHSHHQSHHQGHHQSHHQGHQSEYGGANYGAPQHPQHNYGAPPPQSYGAPPLQHQAPPNYGGYPPAPIPPQHQPPPYGGPPAQQYSAPPQYGAPPPAPPPQHQYYGQPQAPPPQSYGAPPPQSYGAPPPHQPSHQQGYGSGSNNSPAYGGGSSTPSGYRPPPPPQSSGYQDAGYGGHDNGASGNSNPNRPPGGPYGSQLSSSSNNSSAGQNRPSIPPAGRNSEPPIKLTPNQVNDLK
eukprot:CAMPEP_0171494948 /NCGR_PEP_ID=MMETSP0958-20121227/5849_1 /TAXON_ID=87120 /ORGANISM="Aurantiochytrium limacinum, Strain ATCCMYA-1381" /LENGTH=697 /DNA_ID=CAMNT_0012028835 /DNA_START=1406 /DNA_END=3496 /DNA_ORIENTATION=+